MTDTAASVEENGLHKVGARLPLWTYLRETWDRRDFMWTMAQYRLQSENERNRLGILGKFPDPRSMAQHEAIASAIARRSPEWA